MRKSKFKRTDRHILQLNSYLSLDKFIDVRIEKRFIGFLRRKRSFIPLTSASRLSN